MTNNIFKLINNRRSIRSFTGKDISEEILESLLQAGIRAPFAAQLYSIVYTRKPEVISKFKKIGAYKTTNVLMFFLLDLHKLEKVIKKRNHKYDHDDLLIAFLGIQDATLVCENIILAAEAYELGSVLLGAAPVALDLIKEEFNLPKRVFPIVGLCLGYPDHSVETNVRPRYPLKNVAFEDKYKSFTDEDIEECMKQMDEGYLTQGYYIKLNAKIPLKNGKDDYDFSKYSWSEHISRKMSQGRWSKDTLKSMMEQQDFNIE